MNAELQVLEAVPFLGADLFTVHKSQLSMAVHGHHLVSAKSCWPHPCCPPLPFPPPRPCSNIPPAGPQPGPSAGPMPTPAGAGAGPSSAAHLAHTSANHSLQHQHAGAPQAMHLQSGSGQLGHAASSAAALPARAASQRQLATSQPPSESKADGKGGGPKPKKMVRGVRCGWLRVEAGAGLARTVE